MTDKPTPTDAELKAMWQLHAADIGGIFCYARAVLAKWGQPAQAADAEARRVDELTALRKQDTELIRQLVDALETADATMPFPVERRVLKVARARLEGKP